jgi:hypothetical protein
MRHDHTDGRATFPRVERVHITVSDNPSVRAGQYASIAHADAMLGQAYAAVPAPDGGSTDLLLAAVIWTDGYELRPRIYVSARLVRDAQADGGILRHALLRAARAQAAAEPYRGYSPEGAAIVSAAGREALARIEADTRDDEARRNAASTTWRAPSLLPDPVAAIGHLRERFASRRKIHRAVGEWSENDEAGAYPATTHADVRYVMNYVSLALRADVATLGPTAGAVVWNHWSNVRDSVETLLRAGTDTDVYQDNEGLWTRQLPALVRLLDDARDARSPLRNAALHFRPVGRRGEPYPEWVADLRGRSGAYVIRAPGASGEREIVYAGSSGADRLYETLTRHLQLWRRWQGHGRDYGEGHDPGMTYARDTAEAAVILTPRKDALELEMQLIETLRPRDNILGKPNTEDWDWFHGTSQAADTADEIPF